MQKFNLKVTGMSCAHCEKAVVNALEDLGITATASAKNATVTGEYDPTKISLENIKKEIAETGYPAE